MAFQPVPNATKVAVVGLQDEQEVIITLGVRHPDLFLSEEDTARIANYAGQWVGDEYAPSASTSWSLLRVEARGLYLPTGPVAEFVPGLPITGSINVPPQANNVSWVVSFLTGLAGRSFRGRNYITGIPSSAITSINELFAVSAAAYLGIYAALNSFLSSAVVGAVHAVISREQDGVVMSSGEATPVTSYSFADLTLDSQRRRLPNRGT